MIDKKVSTLYLSTSMINTTANQAAASSAVGYWTGGRQQFGFYVKMRQLLGTSYDKYDKFVISLTNFWAYNESNMTNGIPIEHHIGGLNWIDSAYDQVDRANTYWAPLMVNNYGSGATGVLATTYTLGDKAYIFRKPQNEELLEFRCINPLTGAPSAPSTNTLPTFVMEFKIYPLIEN